MNVQMVGFSTFPSAVSVAFGTFSDPDLQKILAWVRQTQNALLQTMFNPGGTPGFAATNSQLFEVWVQSWINASISAQQISATPLPAPPLPVVIGP